MGLTAIRRLAERRPTVRRPVVVDAPISAPVALHRLDNDSFEPLAGMAREVSRELGGDGLLITWYENVGQPQHLFADGACEAHAETAGFVAEAGAAAAHSNGSGAKSQWRALANDASSSVLTTSIPAERGVLTITTLFRKMGRSTKMRGGETAARLMPLLLPFFRVWLSRLKMTAMVRALTAVVNDSDVGVLLLDKTGQIIFGNSTAEELLKRGDGLRRKGATIVGDTMSDTLRLHAAIEQAVASCPRNVGGEAHRIVALRRRDGAPLMAAIVANADISTDAADCSAIVYIVDPDQDLQPLIQPICSFYGLSPAETRLACTLVAGHSVTEAADLLKVREQTARTYLKQVFLKTETNRQAELVRLLLLSAVRAGHVTPAAFNHP